MQTAKGFNSYYIARENIKIETLPINKVEVEKLWDKLWPWVFGIGLILLGGLMW